MLIRSIARVSVAMESEADLFCNSLIKWLTTFPVKSRGTSAESLCDGVTMAQVGIKIDII